MVYKGLFTLYEINSNYIKIKRRRKETIINIEKEKLIPNHMETARYLGYSKLNAPEEEIFALIEQAATQMHKIINPKAVFQDFELEIK